MRIKKFVNYCGRAALVNMVMQLWSEQKLNELFLKAGVNLDRSEIWTIRQLTPPPPPPPKKNRAPGL